MSGAAARRVLIVSPHFPPTDVVDMHRVRMNVRHYPNFGWQPIVLAVEPGLTGRMVEPRLSLTVPEGLEIHRSGAMPEYLTRKAGVGALGLRAHTQLARLGDEIIQRTKPDLAFFSTTAFPVMTLGARWRRRFGLPYVLDIQDPWHTIPADALPFRGGGLKSKIMDLVNRRMEQVAMEFAGGLIAVSPRYIQALRNAYPRLQQTPAEVIPFGHESSDLDVARAQGQAASFVFGQGSGLTALFAGRAAPDMIDVFQGLLNVQRAGLSLGLTGIERLRLAFLGTGYQSDNPSVIAPLARGLGLEDRVCEQPNRVSLLDAMRTVDEADILIVAGSNDRAYQPSKFYQSLATGKPIVIVAPPGSPVLTLAGNETSVFPINTGADPGVTARAFSAWLEDCAQGAVTPGKTRQALVERYSAAALAEQECRLFDQVIAAAAGKSDR